METTLPATRAAANVRTNYQRIDPSQWETSLKSAPQSPRLSWCDGFCQDNPVHWFDLDKFRQHCKERDNAITSPSPQNASRIQQERQHRPICWMRPKSLPPTMNTTVTETTTSNERLKRVQNPQLKKLLLRTIASLAKHTQLNSIGC